MFIIDNAVLAEEKATAEREWRDKALSDTDAMVLRHRDQEEGGFDTGLSAEQYAVLQAYRQALRDWPESADFPATRPGGPDWLPAALAA